MKNKVIRNFIYMDIDSLYSLYSQVFEGVAEQITRQTLNESSHISSVPEPKGKKLDSEVAEASLRIENTILYDHMYSRLEEAIGQAIEMPVGLTPDNYAEKLSNLFLVKAHGKAEIEDYNRVKQFIEKFNDIAEGIAYASVNTIEPLQELQQKIPLLIQELQTSLRGKNSDQKREINKQIQELKKTQNPEELPRIAAELMGLRQDPKLMAYLSDFLETFYPDGYEITIVPENQADRVVFRGILDKKFLRLQPSYLRSLYGGYVHTNWVVVGQVTYLPGTKIPEMETIPLIEDYSASVEEDLPEQNTTDDPMLPVQINEQSQVLPDVVNAPIDHASMRDPFRGMFKSAAFFDKMFFESKTRVEVLLRPLAIYQEVTLPAGKDEK